jgi:hypothetical protein
MLGETSNIPWVVRTVAHEWTHNYLLPSYIGRNYATDSTARIINETAASIVDQEIGPRVLKRFYPELTITALQHDSMLMLSCCHAVVASLSPPAAQNAFNFNQEMRETRVTTDELLAQGKIEQAEAYMEQRRALFVENGYAIRKLNQAYFAFHGAYNAVPGGAPAAGRDPIGPAVQALRARSATLGHFVRTIATVTSLEDVNNAGR